MSERNQQLLGFYWQSRIDTQRVFYAHRQGQSDRAFGEGLVISESSPPSSWALPPRLARSPARPWDGPRAGRLWQPSCPRHPWH